MKDFLKETDFNKSEQAEIFTLCKNYKETRASRTNKALPLEGQSWGMLFYKNSTRTRISFEVGIRELGGHPIFLDSDSTQLKRGESIYDTAKVLSSYLHGLVIRTFKHEDIITFSQHSSIPVINALTDLLHPCQIYSDAFTLAERWQSNGNWLESLKGRKIAFLGDTGSNVAHSWIIGAAIFGMEIALAGPEEFQPNPLIKQLLNEAQLRQDYYYTNDPCEAVCNADVVYTDVWISMGDEGDEEKEKTRIAKMRPYAVTSSLMEKARPKAYFMHCLPAHYGLEVEHDILNSPQSIVFEQAENRLHTQKAILKVLSDKSRRIKGSE